MGKITFLVGGAVGYVLGTRAGREQYEQIKGQAKGLWENPKVQDRASQAQDYARDKAPEVKRKVTDAASKAAGAAKQKADETHSADTADSRPNTYPNADTPDAGFRG